MIKPAYMTAIFSTSPATTPRSCVIQIMAIPNCEYFEVLLPDAVQKHGLVQDIEVDAEGMVHAHQGPGLGAEIDHALIERNKVAEL